MIDRVSNYPEKTFSHFIFAVVDSLDEDKIMSKQHKCLYYYAGEEALQFILELYNDDDASYLNEINNFIRQ